MLNHISFFWIQGNHYPEFYAYSFLLFYIVLTHLHVSLSLIKCYVVCLYLNSIQWKCAVYIILWLASFAKLYLITFIHAVIVFSSLEILFICFPIFCFVVCLFLLIWRITIVIHINHMIIYINTYKLWLYVHNIYYYCITYIWF